MLHLVRALRSRLVLWWAGPDRQVLYLTLREDGGMQIRGPDTSRRPARDRLYQLMEAPPVKWGIGLIGAIIVTVAAAAIIKSLGLS